MQLDRRSLQAAELLPLLLRGTAPADAASRDALQRLAGGTARWRRIRSRRDLRRLVRRAREDAGGRARDVPRGRTRGRFLINALREDAAWCDDVRTPRAESCADFRAPRSGARSPFSRSGSGPIRTAGMAAPAPRHLRPRRLRRREVPEAALQSRGRPGRRRIDRERRRLQPGRRLRDVGRRELPAGHRSLEPLESRFVHTTGQSGNAFSRGYRDFLPLWRAGELFPIGRDPSVRTLVLEP